jgi:hypothetical protein
VPCNATRGVRRWGEGSCIIIDTNVALHQMDFLDVAVSDGVLHNMIVLQTVLEEVSFTHTSAVQNADKKGQLR